MRHVALIIVVGIALTACAQPLQTVDYRTGTGQSPYRSIPAYIECGDCVLSPK